MLVETDEQTIESRFALLPQIGERSTEAASLSKEDREFWQGKPPEEIILATGSVRKAYMMIYQLYGFVFVDNGNSGDLPSTAEGSLPTIEKPMDLQNYLERYIRNGDNHIPPGFKKLLGYYHGVPIYVENSAGETANNDPEEQAQRKAGVLVDKYKKEGRDVVVISTDTSQQNFLEGVDRELYSPELLGKPVNNPNYPNPGDFASTQEYEQARRNFNESYWREHYAPGTEIVHTNCVVVARTFKSEPEDFSEPEVLMILGRVELEETIGDQVVEILGECAGGGVPQQLIDWLADPNPWRSYGQIVGLPWGLVDKEIQALAKTENLSQYRRETVWIPLPEGEFLKVTKLSEPS